MDPHAILDYTTILYYLMGSYGISWNTLWNPMGPFESYIVSLCHFVLSLLDILRYYHILSYIILWNPLESYGLHWNVVMSVIEMFAFQYS